MNKPAPPKNADYIQPDTIDKSEVEKFAALADEWWNPNGQFRALHRLNPARLTFIRDEVCAHYDRTSNSDRSLAGLSILDVGCGGGLIAEPLTRLGADVTAIDASAEAIQIAREHAALMDLDITYRCATVEHMVEKGEVFDVVLNLEVVEHVANPSEFLQSSAQLVGPHGMMIAATLNRTLKAFALAVIGAEYVLGWIPRGTHDWNRFVRPSELAGILRGAGLTLEKFAGVTYSPIADRWRISPNDLDVNYMALAIRD
jgi:2-polyprenyl-6-hydroxyphenyl methylase / 3-demethylubiquinone-9 3-methyltransferase